jgi:hypothetical protein
MILHLLPQPERIRNRRRWSFRFGGLGIITTAAVGVWNLTPADWHPTLPEWGKYTVMGIAISFAILAQASHMFDQPSLDEPKPPAGNDFHQGANP